MSAEGAAICALPVKETIKRIRDGRVETTLDRENLWSVQTPQAFRFAPIRSAHAVWSGGEATDDAQVARAAGLSVAIVEGDPALEKLTYEADFRRAAPLR